MLPTVYTIYGVAMGHLPEALAACGGLAPAGVGERRERPVAPAGGRAWRWRVLFGWLRWARTDEDRRRARPVDALARALPASR